MQGRDGQTASAQRTFYKDGKAVKTESIPSSRYRPLSTIYEVGPGTDTSQIVNGSIPSTSSSTPEPSTPESSTPESSVPESSAPESSAPQSSAPESSTSETSSEQDAGVIVTPPSEQGEASPSQAPAESSGETSVIPVG